MRALTYDTAAHKAADERRAFGGSCAVFSAGAHAAAAAAAAAVARLHVKTQHASRQPSYLLARSCARVAFLPFSFARASLDLPPARKNLRACCTNAYAAFA